MAHVNCLELSSNPEDKEEFDLTMASSFYCQDYHKILLNNKN